MSKAENPPAFPRLGEGFGHPAYDEPGMTLRDYFAGQALVGGMSAADGHNFATATDAARQAYEIADAMLTERTRKESSK